ncbi:MAG: hypothetical protein ITG02_15735 [Patulibacter sp.]|nr:hypothetical protein [Patulibacter sp.]
MSLFLLVAVMAAAVAGGVAAERRWQDRAERRTRGAMSLMLTWVLPPVYFVLVSRIHPDLRLVGGLLTAYAVLAVVGVVAWWVADRVMKLPRPTVGAVILAVTMANTGYFGLPLTRVVLGPDELGAAVAWDSLVSGPMFFLVGFAVGAAFAPPGLLGPGGAGTPERRLVAFLKNPLLWSAIAGLAIPVDAPAWSAEIAQWVVYALLPVGFVVVGVQLSGERRLERAAAAGADPVTVGPRSHPTRRRIIRPEVALAVGLRLVVAPLLVVGVSLLALDLPKGMLLQAVAPAGLNGLLVAHRFNLTLQPIASSIVWTTSLVTVGVVVVSIVG